MLKLRFLSFLVFFFDGGGGGGGQVHLTIVTTNSYHQVIEQAEYGLPHVLRIQNKVSLL